MFVFNEKQKVEQDDARKNDDGNDDSKSSVKWFCHFPLWIAAVVVVIGVVVEIVRRWQVRNWVKTLRNISLSSNLELNRENKGE